jgi:hypothetical protein
MVCHYTPLPGKVSVKSVVTSSLRLLPLHSRNTGLSPYKKVGRFSFFSAIAILLSLASHDRRAFGFLTFTECAERPDLYGDPSRFDTMSSPARSQPLPGHKADTG